MCVAWQNPLKEEHISCGYCYNYQMLLKYQSCYLEAIHCRDMWFVLCGTPRLSPSRAQEEELKAMGPALEAPCRRSVVTLTSPICPEGCVSLGVYYMMCVLLITTVAVVFLQCSTPGITTCLNRTARVKTTRSVRNQPLRSRPRVRLACAYSYHSVVWIPDIDQ